MNKQELEAILRVKNSYRGLSVSQAAERLKIYGLNARPDKKKISWPIRLLKIFTEPMMILIIATGLVYFFIGEKVEGTIFFISVIPIGLMDYFQQRRTDRAVAELDRLLEDHCRVYRSGKMTTEEAKNLVPGDLVHLTAGDKVPADGYILSGNGLMLDESVLTGESKPATKKAVDDGLAGLSEAYKLFQGTLVTQGDADFLTVYTGIKTEYGRLGSLLEKITKEKTPLQQKINKLIRVIAIVATAAALSVGLLVSLTRGVKDGLLGGLTMGMSLIPEEFPIVFSVFLVMGVWRLARKNALVREMVTVETLGAATVICTDKTGTLTEGRMSFEKIFFNKKTIDRQTKNFEKILQPLVKHAILSLERAAGDPLEKEMQRFAEELGIDLEKYFEEFDLLKDSAFDASTRMTHHIWQNKSDNSIAQYSVGAPEAIIAKCSMSAKEKSEALKKNEEFASSGLRVIALAGKTGVSGEEITAQDLKFVGLAAFNDPPREKAKEAVEICRQAGIRVIMITGDNKLTAKAVAESVGLSWRGEIINGDDLLEMSPAALRKLVMTHDIFARVRPEQKFLIVESLKAAGEVVAMTGDGVNDAPALKKADIGIAMGKRGTEVARQAADMILLDDNFFTIARAVKEGRKIYNNLQQAFAFLLSFHLPIVFIAIFPLFFGQPLIFLPIHVIFLELICDPASVLGFENEKAPRAVMKIKPRPPKESLIPPALWGRVISYALAITTISLGFYWYVSRVLENPALARALAFITLIISQAILVFVTREWYQIKNNLTLTGISLLTLLAVAVISFTPVLSKLFRLQSINWFWFATSVVVSLTTMFLLSVVFKFIHRRV